MIRILVVDDHDVIRDSLCLMLSSQTDFFVAGSAENGEVALDLLQSGLNVDILLTDINMPVMDGLELTRKVTACNLDLYVIILSMHTTLAMSNSALEAGANAFLSKDTGIEDLFTLIRNYAA